MKLVDIKLDGHKERYSSIDKRQYENRTLYLMENNTYGDETANIIVEMDGTKILTVMEDVWNGFEDLDYELENGKTIGGMIIENSLNSLEA